MSRALWITCTAVFLSLLLYLAFVGHRDQVVRITSAMPNVLNGLTQLVDRISLPSKTTNKQDIKTTQQKAPEQPGASEHAITEKQPQKTVGIKPPTKPAVSSDIELSNVKYDKAGQLVLSGYAGPGMGLDFFIDGVEVKSVQVETSGRWKLVVPSEVISGPHKLEAVSRPQEGLPKTVVVLPFIMARPEEIAALLKPSKTILTQKIPNDLKTDTPSDIQDDLLKTPARKTSPGFSKLAELARSQSVQRDVDPLIGLMPKLITGDGPSLVTPQSEILKNNSPKTIDTNKFKTVRENAPIGTQKNNQPELVAPKLSSEKQKKIKNAGISPPKNTLVNNPELHSNKKPVKNKDIAVKKKAKKSPYTGYRNVTVPAGRGLVVVQPGNTLWDLAISIYGSGQYYQKLYEANWRNIRNPQMIFPGQVIFAPDANPPTSIEPISPPQWSPPQ